MLCDQIQQVLIYHLYSTFGEKSRGAVHLNTTHPSIWSRSGIVFTIPCFMCHGGVNWCVVIPPPSCCCKCLKMCQKCAFAWLAYLPAVILLEELRSSPQEVHSQPYPCLEMLSRTQSVLLLEKVDLERVFSLFCDFNLCGNCLQLIDVGFFLCLDSFLTLCTVMPARIVMYLWQHLVYWRWVGPSGSVKHNNKQAVSISSNLPKHLQVSYVCSRIKEQKLLLVWTLK